MYSRCKIAKSVHRNIPEKTSHQLLSATLRNVESIITDVFKRGEKSKRKNSNVAMRTLTSKIKLKQLNSNFLLAKRKRAYSKILNLDCLGRNKLNQYQKVAIKCNIFR